MTKPKPKPAKSNLTTWKLLRNRMLAGLFVVLPLFITYLIISWLYQTFYEWLIGPISAWLLRGWFPEQENLPFWLASIVAPATALALVGGLLVVAGMFFNSRLHRFVDWFLNNVPGVNLVYSVVSNVFESLQRSQFGAEKFKRVVLVEFPHPGMKVPAFVTSETKDESTGEEILCVYVPTTPVPTSGYMLMLPASKAIPLNWDLQETLQAIVSGGITVPQTVRYYADDSTIGTKPPKIN